MPSPKPIALWYEPGCPNVEPARERIRAACAQLGRAPEWSEHVITPGAPWLGSPTVLVAGADVQPGPHLASPSCRLYADAGGGLDRAPSVAAIVAALRDA